MNKKWFLFSVTIFLFSFAISQSQMITGTIVPSKNKSVVIKPVAVDSAKKNAKIPVANPTIKSPLDVLDTTQIPIVAVSDEISKYSLPPEKTVSHSVFINGTLIPTKKKSILIKPNMDDSLRSDIIKSADAIVKVANPLDVLDTTLIGATGSDEISRYTLPPEKTTLRSQMINGTLQAKPGEALVIVPVSPDSLSHQVNGEAVNPLFPPERSIEIKSTVADTSGKPATVNHITDPMDGIDTVSMLYDPSVHIYTSTVPPTNLVHQMVTGTIVAKIGMPVTIEPITKDSLDALNKKLTDTIPVVSDTTTAINNFNSTNSLIGNLVSDTATASSSGNMRVNFFVNQIGKFFIRCTTDKFYLNFSQMGKLIDFEIISNGKITSNANSKIVQVGNIKVDYNTDGTVGNIADVHVAYTYDGRINRVGNIPISYSNKGFIEKVADIPITYNINSAVEKIATYRVGYDAKQTVIGIDDSNGLVVFKPTVK